MEQYNLASYDVINNATTASCYNHMWYCIPTCDPGSRVHSNLASDVADLKLLKISLDSQQLPDMSSTETGHGFFFYLFVSVVIYLIYSYQANIYSYIQHLMCHLYCKSCVYVHDLKFAMRNGFQTVQAMTTIYSSANKARICLNKVTELVNESELKSVLSSIDSVNYLRSCIENSMKAKEEAQFQGIIGNIMQLGGIFFLSSPLGLPALVGGALLSAVSDNEAKKETRNIQKHGNKTLEIFCKENERSKILARALEEFDKAVKMLDQNMLQYTGKSLRNPCFNDFVLHQVFGADRTRNITPSSRFQNDILRSKNVALEDTKIEGNRLAIMNSETLMSTLKSVVSFMESERLVTARTLAFTCTTMIGPTGMMSFKGVDLVVRGLTYYSEYKENKKTLKEFNDDIAHLKMQYRNMYNMHNRLNDYGLQIKNY